jgi:hypothetical protein
MWLGVHAELLVQDGLLLVELAPCLCKLVESRAPLVIGAAVARSWIR